MYNIVLHRLEPSFCAGNVWALRQRIYRFVASEGFVQRRSSHVAQNTRHEAAVINDFVVVVNQHISMMAVPHELLVNIDETDLPFDMPAKTTIARRRHRSIAISGNGSSGRATCLLGVT